MPSDAESTMAWWPSNSDQPLDFSKKTRLHVYPPPPPPSQHSPIPKFHHHRTNPDHPPTSTESTPLTMGFFRPGQHSPPPAPQIPLNLHHFNFMDPMLSMNDSFRPAGLLGGLPQLPFSFLDNRRPPTKNMRPFKAYPRDPLTLPLGYCGLSAPVVPMDLQQGLLLNDDAYADFRKSVLLASSGATGMKDREEKERESTPKPRDGSEDGKRVDVEDDSAAASSLSPDSSPQSSSASCIVSGSGISSKRKPRTLPDELKDDAYWERRRKNNEAAKRSRDARRAKEDEIAIRAAYLEQENLRLKVELATMKTETNRLRCLLYNS